MKRLITGMALAVLFGSLLSCESEWVETPAEVSLDLPETPYNYGQFTNANQATLGRVLFYDRQLSINNSIACASCHKQSLAFADNARFSKGFASKLTTRNSMPIQDLGFGGISNGFKTANGINSTDSTTNFVSDPFFGQKVLFWDGRERIFNSMVLRPIVNHIEMGINDLASFEDKLNSIDYYPELFSQAYGSPEITTQKVADALVAFLSTISATNTKFDKNMMGIASLSPEESKGRDLFFTKYDCNSCHQVTGPNGYLTGGTFANVGLDEQYEDPGLARITQNESDNGKFKIPSLRNVTHTSPYMHDGRFETLEEVIDHYSDGMKDNPNLDPRLRTADGNPRVMNITDAEKKAIIAFLGTLTDYNMLQDVRFSDPFKIKQN